MKLAVLCDFAAIESEDNDLAKFRKAILLQSMEYVLDGFHTLSAPPQTTRMGLLQSQRAQSAWNSRVVSDMDTGAAIDSDTRGKSRQPVATPMSADRRMLSNCPSAKRSVKFPHSVSRTVSATRSLSAADRILRSQRQHIERTKHTPVTLIRRQKAKSMRLSVASKRAQMNRALLQPSPLSSASVSTADSSSTSTSSSTLASSSLLQVAFKMYDSRAEFELPKRESFLMRTFRPFLKQATVARFKRKIKDVRKHRTKRQVPATAVSPFTTPIRGMPAAMSKEKVKSDARNNGIGRAVVGHCDIDASMESGSRTRRVTLIPRDTVTGDVMMSAATNNEDKQKSASLSSSSSSSASSKKKQRRKSSSLPGTVERSRGKGKRSKKSKGSSRRGKGKQGVDDTASVKSMATTLSTSTVQSAASKTRSACGGRRRRKSGSGRRAVSRSKSRKRRSQASELRLSPGDVAAIKHGRMKDISGMTRTTVALVEALKQWKWDNTLLRDETEERQEIIVVTALHESDVAQAIEGWMEQMVIAEAKHVGVTLLNFEPMTCSYDIHCVAASGQLQLTAKFDAVMRAANCLSTGALSLQSLWLASNVGLDFGRVFYKSSAAKLQNDNASRLSKKLAFSDRGSCKMLPLAATCSMMTSAMNPQKAKCKVAKLRVSHAWYGTLARVRPLDKEECEEEGDGDSVESVRCKVMALSVRNTTTSSSKSKRERSTTPSVDLSNAVFRSLFDPQKLCELQVSVKSKKPTEKEAVDSDTNINAVTQEFKFVLCADTTVHSLEPVDFEPGQGKEEEQENDEDKEEDVDSKEVDTLRLTQCGLSLDKVLKFLGRDCGQIEFKRKLCTPLPQSTDSSPLRLFLAEDCDTDEDSVDNANAEAVELESSVRRDASATVTPPLAADGFVDDSSVEASISLVGFGMAIVTVKVSDEWLRQFAETPSSQLADSIQNCSLDASSKVTTVDNTTTNSCTPEPSVSISEDISRVIPQPRFTLEIPAQWSDCTLPIAKRFKALRKAFMASYKRFCLYPFFERSPELVFTFVDSVWMPFVRLVTADASYGLDQIDYNYDASNGTINCASKKRVATVTLLTGASQVAVSESQSPRQMSCDPSMEPSPLNSAMDISPVPSSSIAAHCGIELDVSEKQLKQRRKLLKRFVAQYLILDLTQWTQWEATRKEDCRRELKRLLQESGVDLEEDISATLLSDDIALNNNATCNRMACIKLHAILLLEYSALWKCDPMRPSLMRLFGFLMGVLQCNDWQTDKWLLQATNTKVSVSVGSGGVKKTAATELTLSEKLNASYLLALKDKGSRVHFLKHVMDRYAYPNARLPNTFERFMESRDHLREVYKQIGGHIAFLKYYYTTVDCDSDDTVSMPFSFGDDRFLFDDGSMDAYSGRNSLTVMTENCSAMGVSPMTACLSQQSSQSYATGVRRTRARKRKRSDEMCTNSADHYTVNATALSSSMAVASPLTEFNVQQFSQLKRRKTGAASFVSVDLAEIRGFAGMLPRKSSGGSTLSLSLSGSRQSLAGTLPSSALRRSAANSSVGSKKDINTSSGKAKKRRQSNALGQRQSKTPRTIGSSMSMRSYKRYKAAKEKRKMRKSLRRNRNQESEDISSSISKTGAFAKKVEDILFDDTEKDKENIDSCGIGREEHDARDTMHTPLAERRGVEPVDLYMEKLWEKTLARESAPTSVFFSTPMQSTDSRRSSSGKTSAEERETARRSSNVSVESGSQSMASKKRMRRLSRKRRMSCIDDLGGSGSMVESTANSSMLGASKPSELGTTRTPVKTPTKSKTRNFGGSISKARIGSEAEMAEDKSDGSSGLFERSPYSRGMTKRTVATALSADSPSGFAFGRMRRSVDADSEEISAPRMASQSVEMGAGVTPHIVRRVSAFGSDNPAHAVPFPGFS